MDEDLLVKKAQKGEEEAFIELMENYAKLMYVLAKRAVNNDEDAADMIQDTILKAYKSIKKLSDRGSFKNWLVRILMNNCNDFLKKRVESVVLEEAVNEKDSDHGYDEIEMKELLYILPEDMRIVVELHYLKDRSTKDIATFLNIPQGTVKYKLYRARKILAKALSAKNGRWK